MSTSKGAKRAKDGAAIIAGLVLIGVIIWLDITTGVWNDLVILAGLAAGLVTFLLTALVLDKIIARSTARRWAPVTRVALSEFLHMIADEERSEVSRGEIVPRLFPEVHEDPDVDLPARLHHLRAHLVAERRHLSEALGRWAEFLASSGLNEDILRHIADIATQLDRVRDASLELERAPSPERYAELAEETRLGNASIIALETELRAQLIADDARRLRARASG